MGDASARDNGTKPGRGVCDACLRARATCICRWIVPQAHQVEVLILQHPLEVSNAKGSARLLHLSLPHSVLLVGEQFEDAALRERLSGKHNLLLYPDSPDLRSLGIVAPPPLAPDALARPEGLRLVLLDGTWRKSRKMLYLNRALQALPRLPLRATPPSHYLIRRAHAPDQLSTLEACCYALMRLERDGARLATLIDAFDGFVAQQQGYIKRRARDSVDDA